MPASHLTVQEEANAVSLRIEALLADIMQMKQNNTLPKDLQESDIHAELELAISCLLDQGLEFFNETKKSKLLTEAAKTNMDQAHMSLSNVMYEKRHFVEEIIKCQQYRSLYETIELAPLDDFMARAPEDLRQDIDNPHQLMINRLKFERHERLLLKEKCEHLAVVRKVHLQENRKLELHLDHIDMLYHKFHDTLYSKHPLHKDDETNPSEAATTTTTTTTASPSAAATTDATHDDAQASSHHPSADASQQASDVEMME